MSVIRHVGLPLRATLPTLIAWLVSAAPVPAQLRSDSDLDLVLNYGYLAAFFDPGIAGFETEDRTVRVLNVPLAITLRDWTDRGWGIRLRLAAVQSAIAVQSNMAVQSSMTITRPVV